MGTTQSDGSAPAELIPIDLDAIKAVMPSWPFGKSRTYDLIKRGHLRVVMIGTRRFVTAELLAEFITAHTTRRKTDEEAIQERLDRIADLKAASAARAPNTDENTPA